MKPRLELHIDTSQHERFRMIKRLLDAEYDTSPLSHLPDLVIFVTSNEDMTYKDGDHISTLSWLGVPVILWDWKFNIPKAVFDALHEDVHVCAPLTHALPGVTQLHFPLYLESFDPVPLTTMKTRLNEDDMTRSRIWNIENTYTVEHQGHSIHSDVAGCMTPDFSSAVAYGTVMLFPSYFNAPEELREHVFNDREIVGMKALLNCSGYIWRSMLIQQHTYAQRALSHHTFLDTINKIVTEG